MTTHCSYWLKLSQCFLSVVLMGVMTGLPLAVAQTNSAFPIPEKETSETEAVSTEKPLTRRQLKAIKREERRRAREAKKLAREKAREKRRAEARKKSQLSSKSRQKGQSTETATMPAPTVQWKTAVNSRILGQPSVLGSTVYLTTAKNQLVLVNKNTGQISKTLELPAHQLQTAPLAASANQVLLGTETGLLSVNPQTGQQQWIVSTPLPVKALPAVSNGNAFFTSQNGQIYSVSLSSGQSQWIYQAEKMLEAPPVVVDGVLYVADYDGNAYALDATTGKLKWQERIEGPVLSAASVDTKDETVYFSSAVGAVFAMFTGNGRKKWSYTSVTGAPILSQPLSLGNGHTVIADSDGRVGGASQQFGVKTWQAILDFGGVYSGLEAYQSDGQNSVVALTAEGNLLGLSPDDGRLRWKQPLNDLTPFNMVKDGSQLFITSQTGKLYALNFTR